MKLIFKLLVLLGPASSYACSCMIPPITAASLKGNSYVALVKITALLPFDESKYTRDEAHFPSYEVLIEEIKLFKGNSVKKIRVGGAHPDSGTWTSCDIDVNAGEEWLIISNVNADSTVGFGMCSQSMLYRDSDGFRNWQYPSGMKWLRFVNENLSDTPLSGSLAVEKPLLFYSNGCVERSVSFKNGKKEGASFYYYPNGSLYGRVEYKKDSLHGKSVWYDEKGYVKNKASYRMGLPVDTVITYMYPNVPGTVIIFSNRGVRLKSQSYLVDIFTGTCCYLSSETVYGKAGSYAIKDYRPDGTIRSISKYHEKGITQLSYDESGKLVEEREFEKR